MPVKCLAVSHEAAARTISLLLARQCIDKRYKIDDYGDRILIPLIQENCHSDSNLVDCKPRLREGIRNPIEEIRDYLLSRGIAEHEIPDRWIRYGDCIIVRTASEHQEEIAHAFEIFLKAASVYSIEGRIAGKYRIPKLRLLSGPGGDITHRENGIYYVFNPEKIMFSPGNVNERIRYSKFDLKGKTVLDMFAGIGYFSFPVAKYTGASVITAVDINPVAVSYLKKGIERNGLGCVIKAINADSSSLDFREEFDFIIMGNFDSPLYALKALDYCAAGGTISMHHLVNSGERKHIDSVIENIFGRRYEEIQIIDTHKVKSYSPNIFHYSTLLRKK